MGTTLAPEAVVFDVYKHANWPEAAAELHRFDGLKVSLITALDRLCPEHVSSCLGVLRSRSAAWEQTSASR